MMGADSEMNYTFDFKPFSPKQLKILTWWREASPCRDYDGIIADGAIRSGKTVSMSLAFVMWAMASFSGANFAICGKTVGSLRRNVINGLKQMLPAAGCRVNDRLTENLLVISCGEVALMPESFVNQATARCSVEHAKWWFNCNPEGPFHWFKCNWIDRAEERRLLYVHFLMTDNLTLSEKTLEKYRNMYTGVFAQRFILGHWAAADGVIYAMFDRSAHVRDTDRSCGGESGEARQTRGFLQLFRTV